MTIHEGAAPSLPTMGMVSHHRAKALAGRVAVVSVATVGRDDSAASLLRGVVDRLVNKTQTPVLTVTFGGTCVRPKIQPSSADSQLQDVLKSGWVGIYWARDRQVCRPRFFVLIKNDSKFKFIIVTEK